MKAKNKTLNLAIGGAFAATVLAVPATAAQNPFELQALSSGYMMAEHHEGDKMKEGNCGANKAKEANCGADKAKEANCGADKKATEGNCGAEKEKGSDPNPNRG